MTTERAAAAFEPRWGADGLVPVVVQDVTDGRVLMVAFTDAEALAATRSTGEMHFHSRSRARLWRKGETSGNTLRVVDLALDCDADAILATVEPTGPACHVGTRSCFDAAPSSAGDDPSPGQAMPTRTSAAPVGFAVLEDLWRTIVARAAERPADSYTASLLDGGVDRVARKVSEEATEVLIAAKDDATAEASGLDRAATSAALASETADLLYHLLVLLAERGATPRAPLDVLEARRRR